MRPAADGKPAGGGVDWSRFSQSMQQKVASQLGGNTTSAALAAGLAMYLFNVYKLVFEIGQAKS